MSEQANALNRTYSPKERLSDVVRVLAREFNGSEDYYMIRKEYEMETGKVPRIGLSGSLSHGYVNYWKPMFRGLVEGGVIGALLSAPAEPDLRYLSVLLGAATGFAVDVISHTMKKSCFEDLLNRGICVLKESSSAPADQSGQ